MESKYSAVCKIPDMVDASRNTYLKSLSVSVLKVRAEIRTRWKIAGPLYDKGNTVFILCPLDMMTRMMGKKIGPDGRKYLFN